MQLACRHADRCETIETPTLSEQLEKLHHLGTALFGECLLQHGNLISLLNARRFKGQGELRDVAKNGVHLPKLLNELIHLARILSKAKKRFCINVAQLLFLGVENGRLLDFVHQCYPIKILGPKTLQRIFDQLGVVILFQGPPHDTACQIDR